MANPYKLPPDMLARLYADSAIFMTRLRVRNEEAKTNPATAAAVEAEQIIYSAKHWSRRGVRSVKKAEGRD
ncbi:MAG: hypothetical protein WC023_08110 [Rhodocyclaceae bacterium]